LEIGERYALTVLVYPLMILMLPVNFSRTILLVSAFFVGLMMDWFYDSVGVHAATLVATAFLRSFLLRLLEPRGGYRIDSSPSVAQSGMLWTLRYIGILMFVHCLLFFAIDAFTLLYLDRILVNAILTFIVSYMVAMLYMSLVRY
ncbi:MAG: hypothetical protein AAFR14_06770, partial [Bacteroidota bacterium]